MIPGSVVVGVTRDCADSVCTIELEPLFGLIICREAGKEEVIYALDGIEEKIFVAEYKVTLPSEAKMKKA